MTHKMGPSVRRGLLAAASLVLISAASALAQSGVPSGSIGIRLLEAPAHLAEDPRAHLYVIDHLNQGDTIHRRVEVLSGLDHRERIGLYAAGAFVSKGRFGFLEGRTQNELSRWIEVDPSSVDLAPRGSATAVVTVTVPMDAEDGERYAVLWAETPPSSGPGTNVASIDRVGIRVYLSVGRNGSPPTDFRIESLTAARDESGRPVVSATVVNTGGRAIDLSGTLRLSEGPGGLSAGPFPVQLGTTIGIGQRAPVHVVLMRAIPDGPWTADLRLHSDLVRRQAHARILFPSATGSSVPVPGTPSNGSLMWLAVILAIVAALAGGLWLLLLVRRRRKDPDHTAEIDHTVPVSSRGARV